MKNQNRWLMQFSGRFCKIVRGRRLLRGFYTFYTRTAGIKVGSNNYFFSTFPYVQVECLMQRNTEKRCWPAYSTSISAKALTVFSCVTSSVSSFPTLSYTCFVFLMSSSVLVLISSGDRSHLKRFRPGAMYEEALSWLVISAPNVILNTSRGPTDLKV